jgi:molybdopterin-binding protein
VGMERILRGKVVEIEKGMVMTRVKVDIGGGDTITAVVTDAAWIELGAKVGDELEILKSSGVAAARDLH